MSSPLQSKVKITWAAVVGEVIQINVVPAGSSFAVGRTDYDPVLAAAAPALLKACKDIDTFFVFFDNWCPPKTGDGARQALMNVKAAIAEAEGRS